MESYLSKQEWISLYFIVLFSFISLFPSISFLMFDFIPVIFLRESGIYETAGAASCLAASLVSIAITKKMISQKNVLGTLWFIIFSILCIFIAGEEVSWGQSFFNYQVPSSITSSNYQGEFNLHNSMAIQSSNNSLSSIFFKLLAAYFIVYPMALVVFPTIKNIAIKISLPTPSMLIALIAILAKAANMVNYQLIYGSLFAEDILHLGEALESIFELSLLILAIESLIQLEKPSRSRQKNT